MVLRNEIRKYNTLCLHSLFWMEFINIFFWHYSLSCSLPAEFCSYGTNRQHALLSRYMRISVLFY